MVKMGPKASPGIRETLARKGNLEIMACLVFPDSEESRDFPDVWGQGERRGTPVILAPRGQ